MSCFLPTAVFFFGWALSLVGDRSSGFRPQKETLRFLITFGEMVGGVAEQPKQFSSLQEDDLKPLFGFFSLVLLLTSPSERGLFLWSCSFSFWVSWFLQGCLVEGLPFLRPAHHQEVLGQHRKMAQNICRQRNQHLGILLARKKV